MNWIKKLFSRPMTAGEFDERIRKAVDVEWPKSMQRLEVKDGDIVVIRHPGLMPLTQRELTREYINEFLDYAEIKAKVMFLDGDMKIGVLTKSSDNQRVDTGE